MLSLAPVRGAPVRAVPVKAAGKTAGVIFGAINMEELSRKVLSIKIGKTGYAYIVQGDGLTIVHPDQAMVMKDNILQNPNAPRELKQTTEKMVKGDRGLTRYSYNGTDKMVAFAPIPKSRWSLALTAPVAEITEVLSSLTVISLATIAVVLLVAAVVVILFARRIARPIRQIETAAARIAAGDISANRLEFRSNDEIGRLGRAFEAMSENLRILIKKSRHIHRPGRRFRRGTQRQRGTVRPGGDANRPGHHRSRCWRGKTAEGGGTYGGHSGTNVGRDSANRRQYRKSRFRFGKFSRNCGNGKQIHRKIHWSNEYY